MSDIEIEIHSGEEEETLSEVGSEDETKSIFQD